MKIHSCNFCGSVDSKLVFPSTVSSENTVNTYSCTSLGHGDHYRIVRCQQCGLVYSSPRPEACELEQEYAKTEDPVYEKELDGRLRTFSRNIRSLSRISSPGRLLDIGAGIGFFADLARKDGWDVRGIEPSSWCVGKAKKIFDIIIDHGTYEQANDLDIDFDVVTMWDVIEHLDDPMSALKTCHKVLRQGGVVALSTMDIGSLFARIMGRSWPWLMKMHIYYFDRQTIRAYLNKCGFEVLSMRVYRHTISVRYLAYKLEAMRGIWRLLGRLLSNVPFINNSYVTFALGDFMEIYARKV